MVEIAKIVMWVAIVLVALFALIALFRLTGKSDREITWEGLGSKLRLKKALPSPAAAIALPSDTAATGTDLAGNSPPLTNTEADVFVSFWTASSVSELEVAWQGFRAADTYDGKDEFWTSQYVSKKKVLGVEGAFDELKTLSETNPNWVWPLIILSDDALASADWEAAERWLNIARDRKSEDAGIVLGRLVTLEYRARGLDSAIAVGLKLGERASAEDRRAIFETIATEMKGAKDGLSEQVLREFALREGIAKSHSQFALAHSYGETTDTSLMALRHYAKLSENPRADVNVDNNMAILYEQFGKRSLSISFYERSIANGNALAACNLALELLENGYLARAEQIMEQFTNFTGIEGRKAAVDAKLAEVRRSMEADRAEVRALTLKPFQQWQEFIIAAKSRVESGEVPVSNGNFRSEDGDFSAVIVNNSATITCRVRGQEFSGIGMRRGPFWEMMLVMPGQTLLGGAHRRAILAEVGVDQIACVALPEYGDATDIIIKHAQRLDHVPAKMLESH